MRKKTRLTQPYPFGLHGDGSLHLCSFSPSSVLKKGSDSMLERKLVGGSFLEDGSIGSNLKNIEPHEGYKGFNQKNVSSIIKKPDPRTQRL